MSLLAVVKPRVHLAPRAQRSDADDAVWLASQYGLTLDDWQGGCLTGWMGRVADDRWAAATCGLAVSRQNGKNAIIEVRELFGMVELGEKFLHTAHEVKTARKAFRRLKWFFGEKAGDPDARFPELNALVSEIRNTNGQEAIVLTNGGSVEFVARSRGSGRGYTVDVLVCDEAQDLTDEELEALLPTISAAPLGNPQVIFTGTPPDAEKNQTGEVFARVRKEGEQRLDKRLAWDDFGVEDGPLPDVTDRALWYGSNPALGGRLNVAEVERELKLMSPEGFARERLGWWGFGAATQKSPINVTAWATLTDAMPENAPERMAAFAVEVDLDRARSSVGAAGRRKDARIHVELAHPDAARAEQLGLRWPLIGTGWVVPWCTHLNTTQGRAVFAVDGGGPAAVLIPAMQEAGLEVLTFGSADVAQACASIVDAVNDGEVVHGPQPELDDAVRAAVKRPFRDGGFAFGRLKSGQDITPLMAVTLARWAALTRSTAAPEVWSIREAVERMRKERSANQPDTRQPITRPDGSRFIPL